MLSLPFGPSGHKFGSGASFPPGIALWDRTAGRLHFPIARVEATPSQAVEQHIVSGAARAASRISAFSLWL